jgi:hypothetical protein
MINPKGKERRRYPRIEHRLPLNVMANGYDFATATQNVSCVGAYCHIDKYIPPFTKVMVRLSLPITSNNRSDNCHLECKGVVVRSDDNENGGFNIAIFFNEITHSQRKKISQYISQFLPN